MGSVYLQYAVPTFFALILVEVLYARLKGLRVYNLRNSLSCLGCGAFTTTVEVFIKAGLLWLYAQVYERWAVTQLSEQSAWTWVCAIITFDFAWYWAHRVSHEVNFLWGGHAPHHQSEEFNLTAGLRQGALQDAMYWPLYLPMALMGFSPGVFIGALLINKFYGFWLHTRTIGKLPLIEGILGTPSAHRVHHGMNDRYLDKNHGGILMVFDRLFGTYQEEDEEVIYGVRNRHADYDPIAAHVSFLRRIWRDAAAASSRWDKLRIWFMPTGWRPEDVAANDPRPPFDQSRYVKFDANPGKYPYVGALLVFVAMSVANQALILQADSLSWTTKALLAGVTVVMLWWLGRLLNASMSDESRARPATHP